MSKFALVCVWSVGAGDLTVCFDCGGVLSNWEPTDDPWVEHAVWFPECRYVLSKKGQEFVNTAHKRKHQNLVRTQEVSIQSEVTESKIVSWKLNVHII